MPLSLLSTICERHRGRPERALLLAVLGLLPVFVSSGCFGVTAGAVYGVLSLTEDGSASNQRPFAPVLEAPTRVEGGRVRVRYVLQDDDGGPLDVPIEWRPVGELNPPRKGEGGTDDGFFEATGGGKTGLAANARHEFLWEAERDLREYFGLEISQVLLRIISIEEKTGESPPGTTEVPFWAGNEPPSVTCNTIKKRWTGGAKASI